MKSSFISILEKFKNVAGVKAHASKTIADYNRELLINQGRDQFKKLIDKGLNVPVGLL